MSWIEESLFSYLNEQIAPAGGVWPIIRPQEGVLPAITYARVSGPREYAMDGQVLAKGTFDVHCYAARYDLVKDLAEQVRIALSAYHEEEASEVVRVYYVLNEIDHYEEDTNTFIVLLEIEIHYKE